MPKYSFYYFLFFFFLLIIVRIQCKSDEKDNNYDYLKYDNVDIEEVLKNDRLLSNYINCLLEKGSCTDDGRELKKTLPDAIRTDCSKCSKKQKSGSEKVMHYM